MSDVGVRLTTLQRKGGPVASSLASLGTLRLKHGPSHAKNAKGAKDCIEKNREHEILCLRALLAHLARFA